MVFREVGFGSRSFTATNAAESQRTQRSSNGRSGVATDATNVVPFALQQGSDQALFNSDANQACYIAGARFGEQACPVGFYRVH